MANFCEDKGCEITAMRANHGRVLWIVLIINSVMFFVELCMRHHPALLPQIKRSIP
jgi:Co/Zn/Cd efflux system component